MIKRGKKIVLYAVVEPKVYHYIKKQANKAFPDLDRNVSAYLDKVFQKKARTSRGART